MSSGRKVPDSPASMPASSRFTQISQSDRRNRLRKNTNSRRVRQMARGCDEEPSAALVHTYWVMTRCIPVPR